ncbi:MAG: hypothetical protein WDZ51_17250 [Pirellulaceae bacterium]
MSSQVRATFLKVFCTLAITLTFSETEAYAQGNGNFGARPGQERQRMSIEGKLTAVQGNVMQVQNKDGKPWILRVDSRPTDITVQGEAEKGWVQPGMFIYFTGKFDRRGNGAEPVSKINVFTPNPENQLRPGVTEVPGFGGEGGATDYEVVGRVAGVARDGKWTVAAGNQKLTVEVADDAEIEVNMANPLLIQIGDTVKGDGIYYTAGQGILSGHIEIDAANPFKAPEDKRSRRGKDKED